MWECGGCGRYEGVVKDVCTYSGGECFQSGCVCTVKCDRQEYKLTISLSAIYPLADSNFFASPLTW